MGGNKLVAAQRGGDSGGNGAARQPSETSQVIQQSAVVEEYSGPIPSARELGKYEDILPGAADRILSMAEQQAAHRQKLETSVIKSNIENSKRGQYFAFIISMVALVAGFILIFCDKDALGIAVVVSDLVALVAVFMGNRIHEARELSHKRREGEKSEIGD